ncbi:MAG: YkgJ family cysteine cluster protein [Candidatus Riflebacteria bacterium]|nr:YkgJ family cysteine cluster protein [Candidatus Riflebacteria bacterium]
MLAVKSGIMLNLYQKIQKIETIQAEADKATKAFKNRYQIDCIEYCAECCKYNDINATPLEFLPLAWHFYKCGKLEELFERVSNYNKPQCIFSVFENGRWGCCVYPTRGLICRLFGFASVEDKHGKACFAACHSLKEKNPELVQHICQMINTGGKTPVIADFYRKLNMLDLNLGDELVPINQAIKEACEIIYMHEAYK